MSPPSPRPTPTQRLQAAWLRRGPLAVALLPVAGVYGLLHALRTVLYRAGLLKRHRLPVPVVVVGNVIAGGAGKTPTAMALVRHLRRTGWHPGIVSRGHGGRAEGTRPVGAASDPADCGDEPVLMALRTGVPVQVGRDRVAAARALLAAHPEIDVLVCDDGLQHLRLARDLEVLVFDERGAGNGWPLPAGPLRESAGRRADLLLYNAPAPSTPRPGFLACRAVGPAVPLANWRAGRTDGMPLADLRGRRLMAAAGIAHPRRFFSMLAAQGLEFEPCPLPDHHRYAALPWAGRDFEAVLVTEKDAVKLRPGPGNEPVRVVTLDFEPEPGFFAALDSRLEKLRRR
ncbi:tetraacyldisaccharide 4'-kinase [Caldimonas tepidiphila]|uniref:tetraacyldisaccharide 4'-kinase n=1 Tax=Caldimonas tepidiphila TaxID=2315841 RepID=UPI000E5B5B83|nr:tetraacyldisaccharide 4'-kinase [Caldimonas tepidiphila]